MTSQAGVREQQVRVGDVTLNVAEQGSGHPVLLLHGFPDSWRLWRNQMTALVDHGHRAIAPDLRGFGESDKPDGVDSYALPLLAGDMIGLLDGLGIEQATVVGHDWGAVLAWVLAALAPDRVDKLVVVSVGHPEAMAAAGLAQKQLSWYFLWFQFHGVAEAGLTDNDWAFFREWWWGGAKPGEDPDADRQIAEQSRPGALTAGLNWYRANIAPETFHLQRTPFDLPAVSCPTLGIWSSHDGFLTEEQMIGSKRFVNGPWRYERLEEVSHWVPVHAADRLNELLIGFLNG